ncbi:hypothetical protein [Bifidobacterium catulorum]|uniref:Uncharacterized protein n=1 Tax=Bifidobacterium catulorum TaxID=1630173 RepID=A0A2U2MUG9_9BIFI|nr:hypothetical protein [Bifidobacterium catulorum]PWG60499.1 hypothetical protein DF200_02585 [Bifidobacterium catulorum]
MERIDVYRGEATEDEDGNRVQGPLELVASFDGLVAPVSTPETPSESSSGVVVDHAVYIRGDEPTGILDTDVIGVRGRRVPVDGVPAVWRDVHGRHVGDVVTVKLREG